MIGQTLGPYRITGKIGEGGMGEVYRAVDTRLDRSVAIKVLPQSLATDPALRERFDREARAISSLQHPHICALFDVGESSGPAAEPIRYLVLELLDGETLAARLSRTGALPVGDALAIAIAVCDALAAAHRAGIIHRDIKPANIFLARGGPAGRTIAPKLLDFGLARASSPPMAAAGVSVLPTTPPNVTVQGALLGTFQYMAPEQAEGLDADARTDIFAFGAMLFEMLSGRPAFAGKSPAALVGAVMKDEVPLVSTLRPDAPKALDHVVARCLAKDPEARWQSVQDVRHEIAWIASGQAVDLISQPAAVTPGSRRRTWTMAAAALAVALALGAVAGYRQRPESAPDPVQFTISAPPQTTFATLPGGGTGVAPQVAMSPDGRTVVLVASKDRAAQLWLRPVNGTEPRLLAGTDGATFPFWSPDGSSVGFFADGKLKRVGVAGGAPITLCDAPAGRGGTWNRENVIVFAPGTGGPLQRVSASGGQPVDASALDREYGESNHRFPQFLPDGRHFLFSATVGTCCPAPKAGRIKIGVLDSLDAQPLMQAESSAIYTSGYLLINNKATGTVLAQEFDPGARLLSGAPFPVIEGVASEGSRYMSVSASDRGSLAYATGEPEFATELTWFDRSGKKTAVLGEPASYSTVALSPDERFLATTMPGADRTRDVFVFGLEDGSRRRLTFDPAADFSPVWSPDGRWIAFVSYRSGTGSLFRKLVNGTENELELRDEISVGSAYDWAAVGDLVIYSRGGLIGADGGNSPGDIWVMPMTGDPTPRAVLAKPILEQDGTLSPDGRWLAYQEGGTRPEVFVQPFPPTGRKYQISPGGGSKPLWSRDGRELFYLSSDRKMMTVAVKTADGFEPGAPHALFPVAVPVTAGRQFAVTRDGQRFLVNVLHQDQRNAAMVVYLNWSATVRR